VYPAGIFVAGDLCPVVDNEGYITLCIFTTGAFGKCGYAIFCRLIIPEWNDVAALGRGSGKGIVLFMYFILWSLCINIMATQMSGAFTDLGKAEDLYYTDPDNCKVEAIPVEYNTRFTQNLTNLSSGTSVFIIPPKLLGMSD